ncbi:hypothetical protein PsorP6_017626 [Peronosclerospora sorghi]|uniref:Uncharacterized protein n=1 Tax=Peronosclerospora sorghi TaxID=230839 RepID=A0ACC0WKU5_9STRA|nr:hypothetical protein PsorP6_017626 [Peronosclerospora sorghi]
MQKCFREESNVVDPPPHEKNWDKRYTDTQTHTDIRGRAKALQTGSSVRASVSILPGSFYRYHHHHHHRRRRLSLSCTPSTPSFRAVHLLGVTFGRQDQRARELGQRFHFRILFRGNVLVRLIIRGTDRGHDGTIRGTNREPCVEAQARLAHKAHVTKPNVIERILDHERAFVVDRVRAHGFFPWNRERDRAARVEPDHVLHPLVNHRDVANGTIQVGRRDLGQHVQGTAIVERTERAGRHNVMEAPSLLHGQRPRRQRMGGRHGLTPVKVQLVVAFHGRDRELRLVRPGQPHARVVIRLAKRAFQVMFDVRAELGDHGIVQFRASVGRVRRRRRHARLRLAQLRVRELGRRPRGRVGETLLTRCELLRPVRLHQLRVRQARRSIHRRRRRRGRGHLRVDEAPEGLEGHGPIQRAFRVELRDVVGAPATLQLGARDGGPVAPVRVALIAPRVWTLALVVVHVVVHVVVVRVNDRGTERGHEIFVLKHARVDRGNAPDTEPFLANVANARFDFIELGTVAAAHQRKALVAHFTRLEALALTVAAGAAAAARATRAIARFQGHKRLEPKASASNHALKLLQRRGQELNHVLGFGIHVRRAVVRELGRTVRAHGLGLVLSKLFRRRDGRVAVRNDARRLRRAPRADAMHRACLDVKAHGNVVKPMEPASEHGATQVFLFNGRELIVHGTGQRLDHVHRALFIGKLVRERCETELLQALVAIPEPALEIQASFRLEPRHAHAHEHFARRGACVVRLVVHFVVRFVVFGNPRVIKSNGLVLLLSARRFVPRGASNRRAIERRSMGLEQDFALPHLFLGNDRAHGGFEVVTRLVAREDIEHFVQVTLNLNRRHDRVHNVHVVALAILRRQELVHFDRVAALGLAEPIRRLAFVIFNRSLELGQRRQQVGHELLVRELDGAIRGVACDCEATRGRVPFETHAAGRFTARAFTNHTTGRPHRGRVSVCLCLCVSSLLVVGL